MKKILAFAATLSLVFAGFAEDTFSSYELTDEELQVEETPATERVIAPVWPAYIAVQNFPEHPDVIGLRLTIPYSTSQESVTGFDVGFWGSTMYFEGLQLNILRNKAVDELSGFQIGIYNTAGQADSLGIQIGLWNELQSMNGIQVGLVNVSGESKGLQVGVINRAEELYGFQIGAINVIRSAEMRFCPFLNIGF